MYRVGGTHLHVQWIHGDTSNIDWEPFETSEEAARLAKLLAQQSEKYQIVEEFDESCPRCEIFRRGNPHLR
jgi:hypothetical protein